MAKIDGETTKMGSLAGGSSRRTKGSQKSLLIINIVPFGTTGQILYNKYEVSISKKVKTHVVTVFFRGTKKIDKKLSDFNICITVSDTFPLSIF